MTTFLVLALIVLAVVALGLASSLGWTADTRDPAYGAGRLIDRQPRV